MKTKRLLWLIAAMLLIAVTNVKAQRSIKITSFKENLTNYGASYSKVYDNNNEACARIRFAVPNNTMKVESNLGVVKTLRMEGEVWAYVPQGTKILTLRCGGAMLRYEIPVEIQSMATYDANVEISGDIVKSERKNVVYEIFTYSITPLSGPTLALGVTLGRHHHIEIGGTIGLNKSDVLYSYSSDGTMALSYKYRDNRVYLRYGFEPVKGVFSCTPQVGLAANFIYAAHGINWQSNDESSMKNASSLSALTALRLTLRLNRRMLIQVTPEYYFGLSKDNVCKVLNAADDKIKKWTEGFNLNAGLIVYF